MRFPPSARVFALALASALLVLGGGLAGCGLESGAPGAFDGGTGGDGDVADARVDARTECPAEPEPTCDLFLHCNCDVDAGEKCSLSGGGAQACLPAGAKAAGEECVQDAECVAGTVCLSGIDGTTRCLPVCDEDHACPSTQACYLKIRDSEARVCGPRCSLLGQDCPLAAQGCYTPPTTLLKTPEEGICLTAGSITQGQECARSTDCAKGFLCVTRNGAASICAQLCDRQDGAPGCSSSLTCKPLGGQTQTGACMP